MAYYGSYLGGLSAADGYLGYPYGRYLGSPYYRGLYNGAPLVDRLPYSNARYAGLDYLDYPRTLRLASSVDSLRPYRSPYAAAPYGYAGYAGLY